jgi:hypothetical protein
VSRQAPKKVGLQHPADGIEIRVRHGLGKVGESRGVVDQHVEPARCGHECVRRGADARVVRDIKRDGQGRGADLLRCHHCLPGVPSTDDDMVSARGEETGDLLAEAAGGSGDQDDRLHVTDHSSSSGSFQKPHRVHADRAGAE